LAFAAQSNAQQVDALRYCNPLPISPFLVEQGRQGSAYARSMADPTAIRYNGKWYLFPTGGMGSPGKSQAWVSEDFVHWQYHPLTVADRTTTITAPTVAVYRGKFYLVFTEVTIHWVRTSSSARSKTTRESSSGSSTP